MTIRPPRQRETSSPDIIITQNESLGLAIGCETATAHWHAERIDYDHALMVSMASWDSGDTHQEAGSAARDWNPSQVRPDSGFQSVCDTGVTARSFALPS